MKQVTIFLMGCVLSSLFGVAWITYVIEESKQHEENYEIFYRKGFMLGNENCKHLIKTGQQLYFTDEEIKKSFLESLKEFRND